MITTSDPLVIQPARRANDYLAGRKRFREPEMLFDEFWREGELALLFGGAGSGKSILAVQVADALSRGGGICGFRAPRGRRRVLYVDLRHTDEQFLMRCAWSENIYPRRGPHTFSKNLLRDRPLPGQDLCEWLRAYVVENGIQAVIIDDLSATKNTHDGTRETLRLMRQLRQLRDELRISILVLAESRGPRKGSTANEADLGRSQVLCTAADSVFGAARCLLRCGKHYLVQTRARSSSIYWTSANAPVARVARTDKGLLCLEFDERFGGKMDQKKRELICEIVRLQDREYKTFREIGEQLGISRSWACELYHKWTPAMHIETDVQPKGDSTNEYSEGGDTSDREFALDDDAVGGDIRETTAGVCDPRDEGRANADPVQPNLLQAEHHNAGNSWNLDVSTVPFAAGLGRRSIYNLAFDYDVYGNKMYIQSRCEHTGKPAIWYKIDKQGHKRRFTRGPSGIKVDQLDAGPFL